jgi:WD40 repeat protein
VVLQPDGKEYAHLDVPRRRVGSPIRSDFAPGFFGGDPSIFHGKNIIFRVRVTKGKMRFPPDTSFRFEFRKEQTVSAEPDVSNSKLFLPSLKMQDASDVSSGVLHCTEDVEKNVPDIFLSDPVSGRRMNLTRGRTEQSGWSQPWGPIGSPDGKAVVFYQGRRDAGKLKEKIWLLEMDGLKLRQISELSQFTSNFTWSPNSDAFAFPQGKHIAVVNRSDLKMTTIKVFAGWSDEELSRIAWSPDGKWIVCGGKKGSVKLVASDGHTQKSILCQGLDSGSLTWGPGSDKLAVLVDGQLCIISLDGRVLNRYGKASAVDNWSSDGRYIAYETRSGKSRQLLILSVPDGKSVEVGIRGDCYGAVWQPRGQLLAFWHESGLMVVGPDGKNPKLFGKSLRGSTMNPSWLAKKGQVLK